MFIHLEFPVAHFGTDKLTTGTLFPIVWEGVQHLEEMGFRVIGIMLMEQATIKNFPHAQEIKFRQLLCLQDRKSIFRGRAFYLFYFRPTTSDQDCPQLLKPFIRAWIYRVIYYL